MKRTHAADTSTQPPAVGPITWIAAIAVALAVVLAACSSPPAASGGSATAGASAEAASAVAYSHCMRSHGVPNYPDPSGDGHVPKTSAQLLGVSDSEFQAAQTDCRGLYPSTGGTGVLSRDSIQQCEETGDCPQDLVQAAMSAMRAYAHCMRTHGIPTWPDPTLDSEGRPGFNLLHVTGFDPNSSQTGNVMQTCASTMRGVPVPVIAPGTAG